MIRNFGIILLKIMQRKKENKDRITEAFSNPETITKALVKGVRDALLQHKKAGQPVVIWRDGETVWLKPEEIHT